MVHAKNYETLSTFAKVMQRKLWPLFFQTRCRYVNTVSKILQYDTTTLNKFQDHSMKKLHVSLAHRRI